MRSVNAIHLYLLGLQMAPLLRIREGDSVAETSPDCREAHEALSGFLTSGEFDLSTSMKDFGRGLLEVISLLLPDSRSSQNLPVEEFGYAETLMLEIELVRFQSMLGDEFNNRATLFQVSKKGIYDTLDLIDHAELMFTNQELRARLPDQARSDFQLGGRCLAFETPTAAGFHLLRAVETVVKKYYEVLASKPWPFSQRDWGKYISELERVGAPEKVTDLLNQVRKNYRNPLMHPEANLDLHEAVSLFGVAQGAINAMLQEMRPPSNHP